MATYAMFLTFTEQGIRNIKESPARVEAAREMVRKLGGEMQAFYGLLGAPFDTILLMQAPNDQAAAKMALALASRGNVRTETHRLIGEEEYRQVISALP